MADDRDTDGPGPDSDDAPDQTREFDPFADEEPAPAAGTDPDRTTQLPAAGDETRQMPAADETRQMPAADEPEQPAAWSGRAGVPPPDSTVVREPVPTEWAPPEDGGGKWWMPIVVGIVALLLVGALIAGIWLIYNANKVEPSPTPSQSPTPAPTSAPATSAAPTTSPPPPPTTAPADVPVPPLAGLTSEQARDELDRLGLSYRLVYRPAEEPANTVIETQPEEGAVVPPGTEITLVIASPLTPTAAPTATPTVEPTS
ncbi:PASTA domain-containing protein [Phytohabitans sp. LJ34]|uniref:PASTA domain-containing protein n=1 Tax=Phytohabitans sp. LJ34 TaxID=3452217 RepID=UPI003F892521